MNNFTKIKNMTIDQMAEFLISSCETIENDYDYDDNIIERPVSYWHTPYKDFPSWYNREEVVEEVVSWLLTEENMDNGDK